MVVDTWIIQSSIDLTNDLLDQGNSPAVLSAIMKQQTTEQNERSQQKQYRQKMKATPTTFKQKETTATHTTK